MLKLDRGSRKAHDKQFPIIWVKEKKCCRCEKIKPVSGFGLDRKAKSNLKYHCKKCEADAYKIKMAKHIAIHGEKTNTCTECKNIFKTDRSTQKACSPECSRIRKNRLSSIRRPKTRERDKITRKDWELKNKEWISLRTKEHRGKNRPKLREQDRVYRNGRFKTDPRFKMEITLRNRTNYVLKRVKAKKHANTLKLLGCDIDSFIKHMEDQFQAGMTWKNHGQYGWHVDHVMPCASFDLADPEQQKQCFHYTNLQPLWAEDNMAKSDKILQ